MRDNKVDELVRVLGFASRRQFARFLGASPGAMNYWAEWAASEGEKDEKTRTFPYEHAITLGISYDWLIGQSENMWSDRTRNLHRELWSFLAAFEVIPESPSDRFRLAVLWLQGHAPSLVTTRYLAALLRVREDQLHRYITPDTSVAQEAIDELAKWTGVPLGWFNTGARP